MNESLDRSAGPVSTPPPAARLRDVIAELPGARLAPGSEAHGALVITGVHHDSREVGPGDLFVARDGAKTSGVSFVAQALERGALAVIAKTGTTVDTKDAALVWVDDVPRSLSLAAASVYGHPTFGLDVVGITGTNGKTTVLHLVRAMLEHAGFRPGVIGTLGVGLGAEQKPSAFTSPEGDELARQARWMRDRGATHLVMEVSSIALAAARCDAVRFRAAVFTNLTQDHLDYHGTMEAYGEAKARLFEAFAPGSAVLNVDDAFGAALAKRVPSGTQVVTYSKRAGAATVSPSSLTMSPRGLELTVVIGEREVVVASPLLGAHNAENLLAAIALGVALELPVDSISQGLSREVRVPGRLERCDDPKVDDITVVVDYAHTPDALERVLTSLRPFTQTSLVCVFGCGGDRDRTKRPRMGAVAGELADQAFLTNDNPRSERPEDIRDAILLGLLHQKARVVVELDRRVAIDQAILGAPSGAVVLVAGKGHETYQIIGAQTFDFDDRVEARAALARRRARMPEPSREAAS